MMMARLLLTFKPQPMEEIIKRLDNIERWAILAAKTMLTVEDVAALTSLSKSTVYKLTCANEIPHYKPNGKQVYFDRSELEAWMKQNRIGTMQEAESEAVAFCVAQSMKGGVR